MRDGHSPIASPVRKCVFDVRRNLPAQLSIAEILEFDRDCHIFAILSNTTWTTDVCLATASHLPSTLNLTEI
jgi:hypothetical protein